MKTNPVNPVNPVKKNLSKKSLKEKYSNHEK